MKSRLIRSLEAIAICSLIGLVGFLSDCRTGVKHHVRETRTLLEISSLLKDGMYAEAEQRIALAQQDHIINMGSLIPFDFTSRRNLARDRILEIAAFYDAAGGMPNTPYAAEANDYILKAREKR